MNVAYSTGMQWEPLGEDALILRGLVGGEAWKTARWLSDQDVPGLMETNAAWDTVGLYVDRDVFRPERLSRVLADFRAEDVKPGKSVEVPITYDGEDLAEVAAQVHLTSQEVADLHCSATYTCFAVGFCPGFPYLVGLPAPLQSVPRRSQPRRRVPAGSVAIAAGQCGIYPSVKPGGWNLIGSTSLEIADEAEDLYLIEAGDQVRFVPVNL